MGKRIGFLCCIVLVCIVASGLMSATCPVSASDTNKKDVIYINDGTVLISQTAEFSIKPAADAGLYIGGCKSASGAGVSVVGNSRYLWRFHPHNDGFSLEFGSSGLYLGLKNTLFKKSSAIGSSVYLYKNKPSLYQRFNMIFNRDDGSFSFVSKDAVLMVGFPGDGRYGVLKYSKFDKKISVNDTRTHFFICNKKGVPVEVRDISDGRIELQVEDKILNYYTCHLSDSIDAYRNYQAKSLALLTSAFSYAFRGLPVDDKYREVKDESELLHYMIEDGHYYISYCYKTEDNSVLNPEAGRGDILAYISEDTNEFQALFPINKVDENGVIHLLKKGGEGPAEYYLKSSHTTGRMYPVVLKYDEEH